VAAQPEALRVAVVHGPNLNLLGSREPEVYGSTTLAQVNAAVAELAGELGVEVDAFQANGEGELVDFIHRVGPSVDGLLVNAGAYTHTSIAIRDALVGIGRPFVEVHLSNVFSREAFRHHSYLGDRAVGLVAGFGAESYLLALRALASHLRSGRGRATKP